MGRAWARDLVASLVVIAVSVACTGGGSDHGTQRQARANARQAAEQRAATKVVTGLRPGDPRGFDPQSWAAAKDPQAVLPPGATLAVNRKSWDLRGDQASVDVTLRVPGQPPHRHWLFLHKTAGHWLVYGSMPLDGQ